MLTKCLLALIIAAAFAYALYLLIRKKPFAFQHPPVAPDPFRRTRYLFYLATLIFLGGLGALVGGYDGLDNNATVYTVKARVTLATMPLRDALKLAWQTLNTVALSPRRPEYAGNDGERGCESAKAFFKVSLEKAVQEGVISAQAATVLQQTHAKMAYDYFRRHVEWTCYVPMMELPVQGPLVLDAFNERLGLLRQAQKKGTLSPAVIAKLTKALRIELQTLTDIDHIDQTTKSGDYNDQLQKLTKLAEAIKNESLAISPVTEEAVLFLLQMEGVSPADAPPAPATTKASPPTR